jgi:outer membrane receptor protein involved in Fe transport
VGGAYMTIEAELSFADIQSGIRTEYTNSAIQYDNGQNNLNTGYWDIFPHISVSRKVNEHLNLTAYYKRMISRPSLMLLNSEIIYIDSLTYSTGNPHLKPSVNDNVNLNVNFYNLDFLIALELSRNSILWENIQDSSNPNITVNTFGNAKDTRKKMQLGISYSFNHPIFNSLTSINYSKSSTSRIPLRNEIMVLNKPEYSFKTSGDIKILKHTNFAYSFSYTGLMDSDNTRRKASGYTSVAIRQHLMNRKLMIALSVRDIFKQAKSIEWINYSNNVSRANHSSDPDSRYVTLTVRYNWGVNRSIQRKRSDTDHIGRISN